MPAKKERKFIVTIHNWTDEDITKLNTLGQSTEYLIAGREICPTTGTRHLQVYFRFKNARSWAAIKELFKPSHIEVARGDDMHNKTYCSKEDQNPLEIGIPKESHQGQRTDMNQARQILAERGSMADVCTHANSYQAMRGAEMILKYNEQPRPYSARRVIWHWGDTGTGKTYDIFNEYPDIFTPVSFKWWDGYDAHEMVLLDDIRGDYCKFHEILMLTGERPFRVETKGGSRHAQYDTIFITSPFHPSDLWHSIEDKSQLLDKIDIIKHYTGESKRRPKVAQKLALGLEVQGNTNLDPLSGEGRFAPDEELEAMEKCENCPHPGMEHCPLNYL